MMDTPMRRNRSISAAFLCLLWLAAGSIFLSQVSATQPTDLLPSDFQLKEVKTVFLGLVNDTRAPRPTAPCAPQNSSSSNSSTGQLPCLSYETLWENDTITLTLVGLERVQGQRSSSNFQAENFSSILDEPEDFVPSSSRGNLSKQDAMPRRSRREVFGDDTRVEVPSEKRRSLPFSAVVKISSGCTGTLVTSNHVLTAAHCVHNGSSFRDIKTLKVGLLKRSDGRMRWFQVEYVKVPSEWTRRVNPNFDYALLKLGRGHRRHHANLRAMIPSNSVRHTSIRIQFASFPGDKEKNTMWYSYCYGELRAEMILNKCDSNAGSSGSGIYFRNKDGQRYVAGVFSGSTRKRFKFRGKKQRVNIGILITPLKFLQIHKWAGIHF